jgi:hypothetical protein
VDPSRHVDERFFFFLRSSDDEATQLRDMRVEVGDKYKAVVYFWNDISPGIVSEFETENAELSLDFPPGLMGTGTARAEVCADNAKPRCVWSTVAFYADDSRSLQLFVPPESVKLQTGREFGAIDLGELKDGISVGCHDLDGRLDGTSQCQGFLTFDIEVREPPFSVEGSFRSTRTNGDAFPGDTVTFNAIYENTSSGTQHLQHLGSISSPGILVDQSTVSIRTWDTSSLAWGDWEAVPPDRVRSEDLYFWIEPNRYMAPGEKLMLYAKLNIDTGGEFPCGGNWLSVSALATADNLLVVDSGLMTVGAVC